MECFALVRLPEDRIVARVDVARGFWAKGVGLLNRSRLAPGTGLWLPGVTAIHTWGMRFAIDVLFFDADWRMIRVARNVRPWTNLVWARGAAHTVELGAGTISDSVAQVGAQWRLDRVVNGDSPL